MALKPCYKRKCEYCGKYFQPNSEGYGMRIMPEATMKQAILIFVLLLVIPSITAITHNTTVTIDWTGNNNGYVRTEGGDIFFNAAPENQTDYAFVLNITRAGTNQTDLEDKINSLYQSCQLRSLEQNQTADYMSQVLFNYTRCALNQQAAWDETQACRDEMRKYQSVAENVSVSCAANATITQLSLNNLNMMLREATQQIDNKTAELRTAEKKATDNLLLGGVIVLVIGGIIYWMKTSEKSQYNRPKEQRDLGFGGAIRN